LSELLKDYYGKISFLSCTGVVGETIYYKDKKSFDKEKSESLDCGRPISYEVFKKQKLLKSKTNEHLIITERKKDKEKDKERAER